MTTDKNSTVETLQKVMSELFHINQQLEGVIHPDIHSKLTHLYEISHTELKPFLESDELSWNKNYDALNKIQEENNLHTVWSVTQIPATELDKKTPTISQLTYNSWGPTQVHIFDQPTEMTWLELWKLADKMIRTSGDSHHIYIEGIYQDKNNKDTANFNLSTGS